MKKPIEKSLGLKCGACKHFSHEKFNDLQSRLNYGMELKKWTGKAVVTFGRCEALGANDFLGCNTVKEEKAAHGDGCNFVSAGEV